MTEDDYWERVRDIRKDEQILHTPNPGKPITLNPDDHHMIVSAMRYAQGRNNYVVGRTTRFVIDHWEDLSDRTRHILTRDAGLDLQMRREEPLAETIHNRRTAPEWETYLDHIERNHQ